MKEIHFKKGLVKKILLLPLLAISLSACSTDQKIDIKKEIEAFPEKTFSLSLIENKNYNLVKINNHNIPEEYKTISLNLSEVNENKTIKGFAGCNNYFAIYRINRGSLVTSGIGTTRKFCGDEMFSIENYYFKFLSEYPLMSLQDEKLYLKGLKDTFIFEEKNAKNIEITH